MKYFLIYLDLRAGARSVVFQFEFIVIEQSYIGVANVYFASDAHVVIYIRIQSFYFLLILDTFLALKLLSFSY